MTVGLCVPSESKVTLPVLRKVWLHQEEDGGAPWLPLEGYLGRDGEQPFPVSAQSWVEGRGPRRRALLGRQATHPRPWAGGLPGPRPQSQRHWGTWGPEKGGESPTKAPSPTLDSKFELISEKMSVKQRLWSQSALFKFQHCRCVLCDIRQATELLCPLLSSPVKWQQRQQPHSLQGAVVQFKGETSVKHLALCFGDLAGGNRQGKSRDPGIQLELNSRDQPLG